MTATRMGEIARSYWAPAAGVVAAAIAWGVLFAQNDEHGRQLRELATAVRGIDINMAATSARVGAAELRVSDVIERLRAVEARR